jgi:adenine-specific DNA-methyltransferase
MTKIEITRTELVWPGKYDENGELVPPRRVNLPFQVIERVNETRATREQRQEELAGHVGTLFDYWQADEGQKAAPGDGWRNKLIWGDNLYVMGSLLEHFAGEIDLIYIDPPFATGADFSFSALIGDSGFEIEKQHSLIEEKAYRDTWGAGLDSYLRMMWDRLTLMSDLLSPTGSLYIHCDWHVGHYLKVLLDDLFGPDNFRNEIVWRRSTIATNVSTQFRNSHDVLFFYTKSRENVFHVQRGEYSESSKKHFTQEDERGVYQPVPLLGSGRSSGVTGQTWRGIDPNTIGKNGMHWLKKPEGNSAKVTLLT